MILFNVIAMVLYVITVYGRGFMDTQPMVDFKQDFWNIGNDELLITGVANPRGRWALPKP